MIPRDRACLACPEAVAAWRLSPAALVAWPQAELLCLGHLRTLLAGRKAAALAAREAARRYCACGRELYLAGRQRCEACRLGLGPPEPVTLPQEPPRIVSRPPDRPAPSTACQICGRPGVRYAGGRYCGDPCAPHREPWMIHPDRYANSLDRLMASVPVPEPYPAPVVTARPCPARMLPQGAARFLRLAEQHDWRATANYSMTYKADRRTGLPTRIMAFVDCRAWRGIETLGASYEGAPGAPIGFKGGTYVPNEWGGWPPRKLSSAEVTAALADVPLDQSADFALHRDAVAAVLAEFAGAQMQVKDGSWW